MKMKETVYSADISNDQGQELTGYGFRNGRDAQHWTLTVMPDASELTLRVPQGQSRGWYARAGGVGEWVDKDPWGRSR